MRVECQQLVVGYRSDGQWVQALSNLTMDIREGEFVTLVGPSGCGKTSLLRSLAGLIPPESGSVVCTGETGRGIGLVPQEDSLYPWMTAIENATFALEMQGMPRPERERLARPVLVRFGLEGRERAYPHELSAGMKQRVAVARAFLSNCGLLLMDEPFGALDAMTRQRLQQELLDEWSSRKRTVLFVTHDVDEAILLSSRVLVMTHRPGRIFAEFPIPFEYPRNFEVALTDEFLALKRRIHSSLGQLSSDASGGSA